MTPTPSAPGGTGQTMEPPMFGFGNIVKIKCSTEIGEVIGIATYPTHEPQYLIRYAAGDGRAVEAWWDESALWAAAERAGEDRA